MRRSPELAVLGVLAAACGGGDSIDLTGVYRVDRAVGADTCDADQPIEFAPFVRFTEQELLGQPYFAYEGCADETAAACSAIGGLLDGFFEPIDDGWLGRSSFSSGGGDQPCALGVGRQTAVLVGGALTIESTQREGEVDGLTLEQCSPEEAERREGALPCTGHSLVEASAL